ncbi:hypothetical protein C1H46_021634 [Malus baccata]|uniref:Uncharacterized protein n=1 Tax=Malus baccata TaxID=106549 RepID=A0A540M236_MALBA|nr:hypothetical protein C1H46_021634 [Malus baccata]
MVMDDDDDEDVDASETNIGLEGSHQTKVATQAHSDSSSASTSRKRERPNKILDGLGKIASVLKNMVGGHDFKMLKLVDGLKEYCEDDDHNLSEKS